MTAPVLALSDVVVRAAGQTILDVPSFKMARGAAVALLGPNGAGKTTLLQVAALLKRPDHGEVAILGHRANARNAATLRRSLAVVFQQPLLFDVRVLDNAAAGLRFQGHARAAAERGALVWLERFGVAHLARRRARDLSGGEAARVALARAFATEPALLLLDEPFSALDAPTRAVLLPTLRAKLQEAAAAALLVTHDLPEAFAFAGQIALLDGGRVVARGAGPALVARPPSRRAAELLDIANILPATLTGTDAEQIVLTVRPLGPTVRGCRPSGVGMTCGQEVTLTIPAGAIRVLPATAPAPGAWNALPGEVVAVADRPEGSRLSIATPATWIVDLPWSPAGERWSIGDRAVLTFPPESLHIIPGPS